MVYTNLKNTALALRREGLSYSEIKARVPVSKATLSKWFKEIKLTLVQRARLKAKRAEAAKRGTEKKIAKTIQAIEEVKKSSSREVGKISRRELWLLGVMLYWKNGNRGDLKKGVHFSSSEPEQIKLFLKWLEEVGGIKKEEIGLDIFLTGKIEKEGAVNHWSKIAGFSQENFGHVYYLKRRQRKSKRKLAEKSGMGLLRIRVKASSMLARQISGWIEGLKEILKV